MDGETGTVSAGIRATLRQVLRIGIAGLLLGPGVSKFLTYGQSVQFFQTLGFPFPAVLVLVVGAIEIGVAMVLLPDRALRVAAVIAVPVMVMAAMAAGPTWQNLGVLVAAVVLVWIDTETNGDFDTEPTT